MTWLAFDQIDTAGSGCNLNSKPMVEILFRIWRQLLQRPSIGIEDNFFDLGGSSSLADALFAEIARQCGRELPSATIFRAPTVAALASLLQQPTLPRSSPFVPLSAGSARPPILIAHGLDGQASFSKLAQSIQTGHPIYGMQARGVDGIEKPFDRIEDMAQCYIDALTDVQPCGPYILVGYSFGGLVALEMAQRLSRSGENMALLVLVDTYPHPRFLARRQRVSLIARRIMRHIHEMKKMPIRLATTYFLHGLERRLQLAGVRSRGKNLPVASPLSLAQTTERVKQSAYVALRRYRPRFYRGKIQFVSAESNSYFPDDPAAVWGKLAEVVDVETVPGGHLDMVTAHFESLSAALTRYVKDAFSEK